MNLHQTLLLGFIFGMVAGAAIVLALFVNAGFAVCILIAVIAMTLTTLCS